MSKAAVNAAFKSLSHDLKERGTSVAILHPGWVQTEMVGNSGNVSADESAAGLLARIEELTAATSGTFWHFQGDVLPW
jgi:NAD(P)-dependent dehydrogenase (short-subunit alcohol dehydrogenase family)